MEIVVHGLSHRTAPLDVRERVAFLPDEIGEVLAQLRAHDAIEEIAVLSTCNRTEFYAVCERPDEAVAEQQRLVQGMKGVDLSETGVGYVHRHRAGVEHLLRVASGIDSMVVGEVAILGQVKTAFEAAVEGQTIGPLFGRLFPAAFHAGKRCRSETEIGRGAVSLEKSAVQLAEKVFGSLESRSVVVVGAGDSGQRVAALLGDAGVRKITFTSRTEAKARELAEKHGGETIAFESLPERMPAADVVVSAVSAAEPVLDRAALKRAVEGRGRGPLLVLDLGVPRNVDPTVAKLRRVLLYTVDDLRELVEMNLGRRKREIPAVEAIVHQEVNRYFEWLLSLQTAPTVVAMREQADRIRREALDRFARGRTDEERELLEKFSNGLVNKLMHPPTVALHKCDPKTHEGVRGLAWTRRLFGLDSTPSANGAEDVE